MIYTSMTIAAAKIAEENHHGQFDKGGMPYLFHPFHLAEQMEDEITATIALLHDVAEDTSVTLEELAQKFPPRVMDALRLLTHADSVPYFDYIAAICSNPDAVIVKMADLRHNMDSSRLLHPTPHDAERKNKYETAYAMLEHALSK
ncbi:MAG: GTP pyrophosphokinase [Oscillospiraceae bacterium]|nr:GTP pyrophosphokinase [Oscillospiraceae bacterium]